MAKSNHRRLIAGVTAIGLGLITAGCSASESSDDKLVIWTHYTTGGQIEALERQNELWAAVHPDIEVEHVQVPFDQLPSRLLATATTQDGPDVIFDNVVVDFPALVAAGVLTDLTPYWDAYEDRDQFGDASVWRGGDGKVYNILSYSNLLGLYYNEDVLDEYGLTPPETIAELDEAMATVAADGRYIPLSMSGAPTVEGAWMFMPLILNEGGSYCDFDGAPVTAGFDELQLWVDEGYVPREAATWNQTDAWQAFMSGRYAFAINGNWNLGEVSSAEFGIGTRMYPAGSTGSQVFLAGEAMGVGAFSDKQDLAWEYIKLAWLSEEGSLINFAESGQIPTRQSVASADEIVSNELARPFVDATVDPAQWPQNEETAAIQTAVGEASSAVISGQLRADEAAEMAITGVAEGLERGGGSC